jgi:hypothetical protein
MAKNLLQAFDEDFIREMKQARSNPEAYERATQKFEQQHGFTAFNSYDSFRKKKKRGLK